MDVIYTNTAKEDVGVLREYELDLAFGIDENNFECTVSRESNPCQAGCFLYVEGTEYGGIIDAVETDTASGDIIYHGRTWHGILNSKVITPDTGQDYLVLSGDANAVIRTLLSRFGMTDLFAASSAESGIRISNFKMDRYIEAYSGIKKMLEKNGGKLCMSYTNGVVMLSAAPVVDYTEGVDSDLIEFKAKQTKNAVNHLICLGGGELAERTVIHLYADAKGNISQTQTLFGVDEYSAVYDYSNAQDETELISSGTDRLKELQQRDELSVAFDETDEAYDIGDIVGAVDNLSGVQISVAITKKIVSIKNGQITISYDNPNASSQATVSTGGGGGGGTGGGGNGSFDALDVAGNAEIDGDLTVGGALNVGSVQSVALSLMPVGYIYTSRNPTSPAELFGGTWERIKDTFILAAGDTYTVGSTGGVASVSLTADQNGPHVHTLRTANSTAPSQWGGVHVQRTNSGYYNDYSEGFIQSSGSGEPHENMPPYLTLYMWERVE